MNAPTPQLEYFDDPAVEFVAPVPFVSLAKAAIKHAASIEKLDLPEAFFNNAALATVEVHDLVVEGEPEIAERIAEARSEGVDIGVTCVLGKSLGRAALAHATGLEYVPESPNEPGHSRAIVSKWACRMRKNTGQEVTFPRKARAGRKPAESKPANQ